MITALVAGAAVWLGLLAGTIVWSAVVVSNADLRLASRRILRWLLSSWLTRLTILTFWAIAGWHVFCQRP